jgi:hypothetical protein
MTNCYKGELPVPQIMVFLTLFGHVIFITRQWTVGVKANLKEHSSQNNYDTSKV